MPDFSEPFILQTDASSVALGAVLSQVVDGARQPVAFISRTLTQQERKLSVYELECLAVVYALDTVSYTHLDVYKRQKPRESLIIGLEQELSMFQETPELI